VLTLAADENFNNAILRGMLRRVPDIDIVRVQDVGLAGAEDPEVLSWAASEHRILLSHDVTTLSMFAVELVESGRQMAGLFLVAYGASIGAVIDDLVLLVTCSHEGEWLGQIVFVPL